MQPAIDADPYACCPNCGARVTGRYCHECGQKRITGPLTVRELLADIARRAFRLDSALLHTFMRSIRAPGVLSRDYLAGRRRGILDPVHYFLSSVFVQLAIASLTRALAPRFDRISALNWLGAIGGVVAARFVAVLVMGAVWQALYRPKQFNLAENYVFSLYAFATVGMVWAFLPLIDLTLPIALGESLSVVAAVCLVLEAGYFIYGIGQFAGISAIESAWRIAVIYVIDSSLLYLIGGRQDWHAYLLPPLPR